MADSPSHRQRVDRPQTRHPKRFDPASAHRLAEQAARLIRRRTSLRPTLAMWEHMLDSLRRRYQRREGVSDEDVKEVERIVREIRRKEEDRAQDVNGGTAMDSDTPGSGTELGR